MIFFLLTSKLQRPAGVPGQARVAQQGVPNMSSILKQGWVARKSLEKDEQLTIGMASASSSPSRGSINSQSFRKTLIECLPHPRFLHFFKIYKSGLTNTIIIIFITVSLTMHSHSISFFSISSKTKCFHQEKISTFPWKYLERPLRKFLKYILP